MRGWEGRKWKKEEKEGGRWRSELMKSCILRRIIHQSINRLLP